MNEFHFHSRIEFKVLKETKKAILIKLERIESRSAMNVINHYGDKYMSPIELWCPKAWLKTHGMDIYVWEQGFVKNLTKLGETRVYHLGNLNKDFIKHKREKGEQLH